MSQDETRTHIPDPLDEARKKRSHCKGWVNRECNKALALLRDAEDAADRAGDGTGEAAHTEADVLLLTEGIGKQMGLLKKRYAAYEEALENVHMHIGQESDVMKDLFEEGDFIDVYEKMMDRLENKLRSLVAPVQKKPVADNKSSRKGTSTSSDSSHGSGVKGRQPRRPKLPTLEIEKFDGDPIRWQDWFSTFETFIGRHDDVSDVDKLLYLKRYVTGEASKCIRKVTLDDGNYEAAINLLKESFGSERIRLEVLQAQLRNLSLVSDVRDVKKMRSFLNELQVATLNLNLDSSKEAVWMLSTVERKIPHEYRLAWSRHLEEKKDESLAGFIEFLKLEVRARERIQITDDIFNRNLSSSKPAPHQHGFQKPTASLLSANAFKSKEERGCTFCDEAHHPAYCKKPMSLQERFEKVKQKKGCLRCAVPGHRVKSPCFWKRLCKCGTAGYPHIEPLCPLLDPTSYGPAQGTSGGGAGGRRDQDRPPSGMNVHHSPFVPNQRSGQAMVASQSQEVGNYAAIQLRTVAVTVNGGNEAVRVLCDTGCSFTTIQRDFAERAGAVRKGTRRLTIEYFNGRKTGNFDVVGLTLRGISGFGQIEVDAIVNDEFGGTFEQVPMAAHQEMVFKGMLPLADYVGDAVGRVGIILGEDVYDDIIVGPPVKMDSGLKATPTIFGYMVHGERAWGGSGRVSNLTARIYLNAGKPVGHQLEDFWAVEHLGILPDEMLERDLVAEMRGKLTRGPDGRYTVPWPFKENVDQLAENKGLSLSRLRGLLKKLSPKERANYEDEILKLMEEEHIELVADDKEVKGALSYLPHFAVVKESSTTKVRIVFDASARSEGKLSLNQCLEVGLNLVPKIFGILLRFREGKIGVVGDLARAFLQISLPEDDRDVTRFFWYKGDEIIVLRFKKIFFGATSSPFILQVVVKDLLESMMGGRLDETSRRLMNNVYVDDQVCSVDSPDEAVRLWKESQEIFRQGGFLLRKLKTNLEELAQGELEEDTVLGVSWDPKKDVLLPGKRFPSSVKKFTKRGVVGLLAQMYDPLGLLSPVVTLLKILVQDLWNEKIGWEAELDSKFTTRLNKILRMFEGVKGIRIPRWIGTSSSSSRYLAVFTDASGRMYATVCYLIVAAREGLVEAHLLCSKSRLAPSGEGKTMSIPRLELMGALLGARLGKTVAGEMKIERVVHFTDSFIALQWIEAEASRWNVFVANRVREIKATGGEWRWTPGSCNPADIPTRGMVSPAVPELWEKGPEWLIDESTWPERPTGEKVPTLEEKVSVRMAVQKRNAVTLGELVNPSVSRWQVLVGAMSRILKMFNKDAEEARVTAIEIIWRENQKASFPDELEDLGLKKSVGKKSQIVSMNPFLDERGLMRMGGRLENARGVDYETCHPVILSRTGAVDLMVLDIHARLNHAGPLTTLVECRRVCRRFQAAPFDPPQPPLPAERVRLDKPFSITGCDLLGPLFLEDGTKVWITLFTCFQIRAVHLEIVVSLSEKALRRAFQRFCSRRGTPTEIWSDHGTNFVALSKSFIRERVPIRWKWIVERGPWMGGIWERLVSSVKYLLKRTLGKSHLTFEELLTVVVTTEEVINKRPVAYVWESAPGQDAVPLPLAPIDFLLYPGGTTLDDSGIGEKKESWRNLSNRWKREYLLSVLGSFGSKRVGGSRVPRVDEVVLIGEDNVSRQCWSLGRITQLHEGRDGVVRSAALKLSGGRVLNRPLKKLFPMELEGDLSPLVNRGEDGSIQRDLEEVNDDSYDDNLNDGKIESDLVLKT
ncbi:hypothetical protein SNEBB_011348, partial [Seison nebaliae]